MIVSVSTDAFGSSPKFREVSLIAPEAFWSRVDKSGDCWLWTKFVNSNGYGRLTYRRKQYSAHRIAFLLAVGDIPPGLNVLHRCDNPPCVRPDHLFLGTQADNMRDMAQKNRHWSKVKPKTHCIRGHEYTPKNTYYDNRHWRQCKICREERLG